MCSVLFLYLTIVCFEINDWANLKVILPNVKYPSNNLYLFEKWFLYQIFNMLAEKTLIEQFKHDWFVSLVFDDFLFAVVKQKDDHLQQQPASSVQESQLLVSNVFYEQIYKLIEKIYPIHLSTGEFHSNY